MMKPRTIILLEDDPGRMLGFEAAVAQLGDGYQLRAWRDANKMMAEIHEALADAALISLDHDLNKERPDSPDPGDGLQVAAFLARLPMIIPVILHTSNTDRVWSMHNEFRFGNRATERVIPHGTDWIQATWLPTARRLLAKAIPDGCFRPVARTDHLERFERAKLSLCGLALGDGIGEMMVSRSNHAHDMVIADELPAGPWWHTDDTEMAISIVETLRLLGEVHQDALARQFAWRYERDPDRGYGSGTRLQLRRMIEGGDWRNLARNAFSGSGSLGNGSAMRVAPVGAWFADDLDRVEEEARKSATVTHAHPEGMAGAIAIAVAAAMAWRLRDMPVDEASATLFHEVHQRTPDGETRRGIAHAANLGERVSPQAAGRMLGSGYQVTCPDTVPLALWVASRHLRSFRQAIASIASVDGDVDTNCAIVGGIVALSVGPKGIPPGWLKEMEPLPYGHDGGLS